jgi:hypothetical protein
LAKNHHGLGYESLDTKTLMLHRTYLTGKRGLLEVERNVENIGFALPKVCAVVPGAFVAFDKHVRVEIFGSLRLKE